MSGNVRKLTAHEINDILDQLYFFPENPEPLEKCLNTHKESLKKQLQQVKIPPENIEILKEKIIKAFFQSIISPGEAVGVNAAQCIGEPITQSTLSTFHHTGNTEMNVTLGFSRSKELMNCTPNQATPSVTIFFKKKYEKLKDLHPIIDRFPQTLVDDLLASYSIISPENYKLEWWHRYFINATGISSPNKLEWVLRLVFDKQKLFGRNTTAREISEVLEEMYQDVRIIIAPFDKATIDILVDCSSISIEGIKSPELKTLVENLESHEIDDETFVHEYYMNKIVSPEIRKQFILGIQGIESVYPLINNGEISIVTKGTNLQEVLKHPEIDSFRTFSNDIWEIYNTLDIEAVREYLLQEFTKIVSMGGNYINSRHVEILVDKICHTGSMRAMARFGIETEQFSVISKASFEEVMKHFINAAVGSEIDNIDSISPNIAVGKPIRAGTGFSKIRECRIKIRSSGKSSDSGDSDVVTADENIDIASEM